MNEFEMMAALTSAVADDHRTSYAKLVGWVGMFGWSELNVAWSEVLARRMDMSIMELRLSVDTDLALEGR